jgi:hypothetical protein
MYDTFALLEPNKSPGIEGMDPLKSYWARANNPSIQSRTACQTCHTQLLRAAVFLQKKSERSIIPAVVELPRLSASRSIETPCA